MGSRFTPVPMHLHSKAQPERLSENLVKTDTAPVLMHGHRKAYDVTQTSLYKASKSCGGKGTTAKGGRAELATANLMDEKESYCLHMATAQIKANRLCSKLCMLPDGGDNSKALLQLFAGLVCQSPQLATTAVRALYKLACRAPQYGKTCFGLLTFGSTTGRCPCSSCTIWATCHLAAFCAAVHLFCLQHKTFVSLRMEHKSVFFTTAEVMSSGLDLSQKSLSASMVQAL